MEFPGAAGGSRGGLIFLDNSGDAWGHRGFGFAPYDLLADEQHGIDEVRAGVSFAKASRVYNADEKPAQAKTANNQPNASKLQATATPMQS